jgi:hypothetical protein
LADCADSNACALAVSDLRSLDRERRDSADGLEARLRALRLGILALASYPEPARGFLDVAGLQPDRAAALMGEEARVIETMGSRGAGAADAQAILAVTREPSCERLYSLDAIRSAGGRFADAALMVQIGAVARLVGAIDAKRVHQFAETARYLLGCRLSTTIGDAEVILESRRRLGALLEHCPSGPNVNGMLLASCANALEAISSDVPLPMPGLASGELGGALLPVSRGYGIPFTPPWVLVLSAGRLLVLDQPVLKAGDEKIPEAQPAILLDLRNPHSVEDVRTAVYVARKDRPLVEFGDRTWMLLAADRSATYSDLMEVLESMLSESDALPALAVLPGRSGSPYFLPINYRFSTRMLLDPWGREHKFRNDSSALSLELSQFGLSIRSTGIDSSVGLMSVDEPTGTRRMDLRGVYKSMLEVVGVEGERSARLTASPTVSVGLLVAVIETMASRLESGALLSPAKFDSAGVARGAQAVPYFLVPGVVIRSAEQAPE